jgi:hypothetical protein
MVDQQRGKLPRNGIKVGLTFINCDIVLYEWMNIIADKNLPISAIEDYDMRGFSRFPESAIVSALAELEKRTLVRTVRRLSARIFTMVSSKSRKEKSIC